MLSSENKPRSRAQYGQVEVAKTTTSDLLIVSVTSSFKELPVAIILTREEATLVADFLQGNETDKCFLIPTRVTTESPDTNAMIPHKKTHQVKTTQRPQTGEKYEQNIKQVLCPTSSPLSDVEAWNRFK